MVTIVGPSAAQVAQAQEMCKVVVHGESQSTVDLKSRNMVLMVCGKGLTNLKAWQEETTCRFDFVERGSTILKITGDADKIARALSLVTERMTLCKGTSLTLQGDQVGAVYGKGGSTLKHIQESTGTNVEITQISSGNATCTILGEPAAVQTAQAMIQKAMEGEVVELKPGEVVDKIDLGVAVSAVIGRGGTKLTELERKHAVKLHIPRGSSICSIVGVGDHRVAAAKADIASIVQPLIEKYQAEELIARKAAELTNVKGENNAWGGVDPALDGW